MTDNDTLRLAKEAGLYTKCDVYSAVPFDHLLNRFAKLIIAEKQKESVEYVESCKPLYAKLESKEWVGLTNEDAAVLRECFSEAHELHAVGTLIYATEEILRKKNL